MHPLFVSRVLAGGIPVTWPTCRYVFAKFPNGVAPLSELPCGAYIRVQESIAMNWNRTVLPKAIWMARKFMHPLFLCTKESYVLIFVNPGFNPIVTRQKVMKKKRKRKYQVCIGYILTIFTTFFNDVSANRFEIKKENIFKGT